MAELKKLAIISTYDDLCGIAGYTRALVKQLSQDYEVTVFDLDQYLLRSRNKAIRRLGDDLVHEIAQKLRGFDCVNIQLEHGTLGATNPDIVRRFRWLVEHDKPLTVTFHTVLPIGGNDYAELRRALIRVEPRKAVRIYRDIRSAQQLGYPIARALCKRQARARTSLIFHTRRDARNHALVYGLERVYHHPLVFYSQDGETAPNFVEVPLPEALKTADNPVILGLFGFISPYKGVLTALRAMRKLPSNYHLMIFGGLHPNEIRKGYSIHEYLQKVVDLTIDAEEPRPDRKKDDTRQAERFNLHFDGDDVLTKLMGSLTDISDRVHFMGALKDEEFASAMRLCDVVVLPYEEVGQSASGPLAIANDVGARIVCARNKAFLQYDRYTDGDRLNFFDIGNYLELAQRLRMVAHQPRPDAGNRYNVETNRAVYKASFEDEQAPAEFASVSV